MRAVKVVDEAPPGTVHLVGAMAGPDRDDGLEVLGFTAERGSTALAGDGRRLMVGLGEDLDLDGLREAAGAAAKALPVGTSVATDLHLVDLDGAAEAVVTGFLLGSYRYTEFKSSPPDEPGDLILVGGPVDGGEVERASLVAGAVATARDWVNRPPVAQPPATLAEEMAQRLGEAGFEVEVWDAARIESERLGGLVGVAAGSDRPPRMVVARRRAEGPRLSLVGKGIVFDSGGLSIKASASMETMKGDMAGAAAVVAGGAAIGSLDLAVDVSVYVPLTDNMSGGSAVKPGDVLTARNGKTIEVLNTDAEGRLVLADALSLAVEDDPGLLVDLATLTGAARVALGDRIAAYWASDDETDARLAGAAARAGERLWRLPLPPDYRRLIDSKVADMKNTGGRYGGAIAATSLLAEFAGEGPWAHLDIAGPAWFSEESPLGPVGGTGFGVATLVALAEDLSGG